MHRAVRGDDDSGATQHRVVGFYPEHIGTFPDNRGFIDCEGCCLCDMVQIPLYLIEAGRGDYWDDIDRVIRNQFAEMQMTSGEWLDIKTAGLSVTTPGAGESTDRTSQRAVGSMFGWALPNDAHAWTNLIQHCCTGNCSRALHAVWERMVQYSDGELKVNLLLNRASKWADIDSYILYSGRVDVKVKEALKLSVRAPEWSSPEQAKVTVNDKSRSVSTSGRFVQVGSVAGGDVVTITFPISERERRAKIAENTYDLLIRGNDVVRMDPPGKYQTVYQRERYRRDEPAWVEVQRYIQR